MSTAQGGADRVYVLTTQAQRIVPIRLGRVSRLKARQMLHVDLWAFDPTTAQGSAWKVLDTDGLPRISRFVADEVRARGAAT